MDFHVLRECKVKTSCGGFWGRRTKREWIPHTFLIREGVLECFEDMKNFLSRSHARDSMRSKTLLRVMSSPSNAKRLRFSPKARSLTLQKAHSQDSGLDHKNFKILRTSSDKSKKHHLFVLLKHFELSELIRKTIKGYDIKGHDDDHEVDLYVLFWCSNTATHEHNNTLKTPTPTGTCSR